MHVVGVAVTANSPIFEVAVPCEVFGMDRPELVDPWYELRVCSDGTGLAMGFQVRSDYVIADLAGCDTVVVPSCPGLAASPELVEALRVAYDRGARVTSICSGAFVLASAGLLDGRRATTHWKYAAEFARRHPAVDVDPNALYVEDGGVFTSAGTAAGLDLCLELVRRDHGTAVANGLARRLVIPPHRDGGQAQYVEAPVPPSVDGGLAHVLQWALARLDRRLTLADLAAAGNMSTRTLARRFRSAVGMSPARWLTAQRIQRARHLLESTETPVERIAGLAGFGSPANLRAHFMRATGVSPLAYRRTFAAEGRHAVPSCRSSRSWSGASIQQ